LYNIVTEFDIITELVNLIKVCLNEICSMFRVGGNLSDANHFRNVLRQGDALSLSLFNFSLEYEGLELNGPHQLLIFADDGENMNTKRNPRTLLADRREVGTEGHRRLSYVYNRHQNAGQNHNFLMANIYFTIYSSFAPHGA